jgi:hypothetical protein
VDTAQPDRLAPFGHDGDPLGSRPIRPHDHSSSGRMGAEHAVRIVVLAGDEPRDLVGDAHVGSGVEVICAAAG